MDGRLQHTVIDDQNTPATGPRSYSTIKLKKGEFFLAEDLTSFKVGDGTKTYESITEDNTYYAGKGAGSAYKFKLNGTTYPSGTLPEYTKDLSNNGIYAPLSGGSGNQVLISLGNNTAPTWANVNISDGLGIINPVGDTYNLILRASSSGHLGGVYSDYSNLFLNNYRVLSSGQSNTDPNYPEVTIFAPTTSTTSASGASISNQLLISQADNQAPIWTGLTLNGSTNGKYLKWDNGWTLDNAGGGTNAYVHIKYANSSNPQDSDMHNIPAVGDKYIGVYSGSASVAPTDHASYVWSKYVGEDGTGVAIKANAESCTQLGDGYIDQNQSSATYGHLMVLTSLSPRTFADAGEIKGPAGEDGATWNSGTYVGNSSHTTPFTSTALTESDVKSGDYYLNSTTYDVYKCTAATNSNSSWSLVCNIKGATGNTGNTGATGNGISSIAGPATSGLHDTYTINFTNGNSTTFTVTNGADGVSIGSISRTSGTGAAGTTDTYTVYDTDGNSIGTFNVYNGADGSAVGDTWRNIQVNGTQVLNTTAGGAAFNLVTGNNNITLTPEIVSSSYTGKVIIAATDTKYKFKLNGGSYVGDGTDLSGGGIYAPIQVGDQYSLLMSNGSGTPTPSWVLPSLASGKTTGLLKYTSGNNGGWSFDSNSYLTSHQTLYNLTLQLGSNTPTTYVPATSGTYNFNVPVYNNNQDGGIGLVPSSNSGERQGNYYLKADGTWATPSGGTDTTYKISINGAYAGDTTNGTNLLVYPGQSAFGIYAPTAGVSSGMYGDNINNQLLISQKQGQVAGVPYWTDLDFQTYGADAYLKYNHTSKKWELGSGGATTTVNVVANSGLTKTTSGNIVTLDLGHSTSGCQGALITAADAGCSTGYQNTTNVTAIPIFYGKISNLYIFEKGDYSESTEFTGHYVNLYDVVNGIIKDNTLLGYLKEALDKYTPKS